MLWAVSKTRKVLYKLFLSILYYGIKHQWGELLEIKGPQSFRGPQVCGAAVTLRPAAWYNRCFLMASFPYTHACARSCTCVLPPNQTHLTVCVCVWFPGFVGKLQRQRRRRRSRRRRRRTHRSTVQSAADTQSTCPGLLAGHAPLRETGTLWN